MILVKITIFSKLHCHKVFKLKPFSYKIRIRTRPTHYGTRVKRCLVAGEWLPRVRISHNALIKMVLESQLPHKIVNSLFTITNLNNKLTVLWGS